MGAGDPGLGGTAAIGEVVIVGASPGIAAPVVGGIEAAIGLSPPVGGTVAAPAIDS